MGFAWVPAWYLVVGRRNHRDVHRCGARRLQNGIVRGFIGVVVGGRKNGIVGTFTGVVFGVRKTES
jgi:hypothetical protein